MKYSILLGVTLLLSFKPLQIDPPATWYGFSAGSVAKKNFSNGYRASAVPTPDAKQVVIRYRQPLPANYANSVLDPNTPGKIETKDQIFATRYWPIEFEWIEGTNSAIAMGVNPLDGVTLTIERWRFSPNTLPNHFVSTGGTTVGGGGSSSGGGQVGWKLPNRIGIDPLYYGTPSALGLTGMPSFIVENKALASSNRFFVGVRGSDKIYHLDLGTDNAWVAASGSIGGVVDVSVALDDWQACLGIDHEDDGYIYQMYNVDNNFRYVVFLRDTNRDGLIDSVHRNSSTVSKYGVQDPKILAYF